MNAVGAGVTHNDAETRSVEAAGVEFAYRRFGSPADLPLVMLQHFRGNLDNWDPALTDALAAEREVILVDYAGVGSSTGEPSRTIASTARQMIAFADALGLVEIDVQGFSIGGFVAQEIALVRPALVRRLVLAATGPKGAPGMHGWREDIAAAARGESKPENVLYIMSRTPTPARRRESSSSGGSWSASRDATHRPVTPRATPSTTRSSSGESRTTPPSSD
jgi:pimeloyl-ACP methyl ester carboxylesterase